MTDGISAALVSPTARHPSAADRNALAGNDEQADFGRTLMSPQKGEKQSKEQAADQDAPREKGLHKLAARLAARDPGVADAKDETDPGTTETSAETSQPEGAELPDTSAKDASKADMSADAALPLVLALSELRKATSHPANAGLADAADAEAGDVAATPAGDMADTERSALVMSSASARASSAGSALPPGMAPVAETRISDTPVTAQSATPGAASTDAAEADKPARPTPAKQAEQPTAASRVSVISEQAIPAPAASGANSTAGALALAIASDAPRHTAAASAVQQLQASTTNAPAAQVLKIQLRPVELGMVTASLRLAGEQLSIEIEVENAEAYHRLSADREAINTALRGLGFDVDRVTILQPQSGQPRSDSGAPSGSASGRDQPSFQSDGTGSEGGNSGNGRPGGRSANEDGSAHNISPPRADRPGSSRYI